MIIKNRNGDIFLEFIQVSESDVSQFNPLTHSLIIVCHEGKSLLIHNPQKGHWELAGGRIEQNESPRECALRELFEETHQQIPITSVRFLGVMKFDLMPDPWNKSNRIEFGTLFHGELSGVHAFIPNEEASGICFWDGIEDIGEIDRIDAKLITLAN